MIPNLITNCRKQITFICPTVHQVPINIGGNKNVFESHITHYARGNDVYRRLRAV